MKNFNSIQLIKLIKNTNSVNQFNANEDITLISKIK